MNNSIQIAAFKIDRVVTMIVKKTKAGHYFVNYYLYGRKLGSAFQRVSGKKVADIAEVSFSHLKQKLEQSTKRIELKVATRKFMDAVNQSMKAEQVVSV